MLSNIFSICYNIRCIGVVLSDISPLSGMGKLKNKETVEKCESYGVFTLGNRLFSYKNSSKRFIIKVNITFEEVRLLYNSITNSDKEYLNYYCVNILTPIFKGWVLHHKQKEIDDFLNIVNNLNKDDEDTQVIIKDLYKYLVANLLPNEQKFFIIKNQS